MIHVHAVVEKNIKNVVVRHNCNHIKTIVKEVFPSVCFNQEGKVFYYRMRDRLSFVLIGMIVVVLIGGAFFSMILTALWYCCWGCVLG